MLPREIDEALPWMLLAAFLVVGLGCAPPAKHPPATCPAGPPPADITLGTPAFVAAEERACVFSLSCSRTANGYWRNLWLEGDAPRSCLADDPTTFLPWGNVNWPEAQCAVNARNCDDWLACASDRHCPSWCAQFPESENEVNAWVCDGDEIIVCDDSGTGYGIPWRNCASNGWSCGQVKGFAQCTGGTPCTPGGPHCVGKVLTQCDSITGFEATYDCSTEGDYCSPYYLGATSGWSADCFKPSGPCTAASYPSRCDGIGVEGCSDAGTVEQQDCPQGSQCVDTDGGAQCVSTSSWCDMGSPDTCDGTSLVTCGDDGKLASIDCTTLGFRTCGMSLGRARCIP